MILRSKTIRLGIFLSALVLAAIVVFQLIWLRKVYHFEQKEFDHSILKAVRNFYEDADSSMAGNEAVHLSDLVRRRNPQTYVVRFPGAGDFVGSDLDSLAFYMQSELEDQEVFTECSLSVYDSLKNRYVFQANLPIGSSEPVKPSIAPKVEERYPHLLLYFPRRQQYILSLMNFWLITSGLLVAALLLLSGSLYYFYRQTFLSEMQRDFIHNFTHEFKTPVSVLRLAGETLSAPDMHKTPERLLNYAGIVTYQSHYLQEQIERLLHCAYAESRQLQLKKTAVSVHGLIEEALKNLQPLIRSTGAEIERRFLAVDDQVVADRGYLLIVVINLIENALKYARRPRVIISTGREGRFLVFSVKDNGKGIPSRYIKNIFKTFYRVTDGDQAPGRGFGLGLSFVRRIVDAHHGRIGVESVPDEGSRFTIKIPLS